MPPHCFSGHKSRCIPGTIPLTQSVPVTLVPCSALVPAPELAPVRLPYSNLLLLSSAPLLLPALFLHRVSILATVVILATAGDVWDEKYKVMCVYAKPLGIGVLMPIPPLSSSTREDVGRV